MTLFGLQQKWIMEIVKHGDVIKEENKNDA
jgi:hypothetical protein